MHATLYIQTKYSEYVVVHVYYTRDGPVNDGLII